jgi:DNA-binding transcriptional LysR family regulator
MEFNDLAAFVSVAHAVGYRVAARIDDVRASRLNTAMRRLESKVGLRRLNRTTRSGAPTDARLRLVNILAQLRSEMDVALD